MHHLLSIVCFYVGGVRVFYAEVTVNQLCDLVCWLNTVLALWFCPLLSDNMNKCPAELQLHSLSNVTVFYLKSLFRPEDEM